MNKRLMIQVCCIAVLLTLVFGSTCVLAQQGSSRGTGGRSIGMQPAPAMQPVIKATDSGLFVLVGQTLTKYDAVTLKQIGTLQLGEKRPDQTKRAGGSRMQSPASAEMIVASTTKNSQSLLLVIGDKFFNIDTVKFEVSSKCTLPAIKQIRMEAQPSGENRMPAPPSGDESSMQGQPPMPGGFGQDEMGSMPGGPGQDGMGSMQGGPGQDGMRPDMGNGGSESGQHGQTAGRGGFDQQGQIGGNRAGMQMGMPVVSRVQLELRGITLYILRGNEIAAVNIADGKIVGTVTLPKPERSER